MNKQEEFEKLFNKRPHDVKSFYARPHLTRRRFLNLAGTGVTASWLASQLPATTVVNSTPVQMLNKAKNVIFILLAGAPSHTDTFDLKVVNGVTPDTFLPETVNGILFPTGLMPKLAATMGDFTIVRSLQAWALVHSLAQTWTQIGRNPAGVLGNVSPTSAASWPSKNRPSGHLLRSSPPSSLSTPAARPDRAISPPPTPL